MIAKIVGLVQRSPAELSSRLIQRGAAAIERLGLIPAGEVPPGSPLTPALPFPIPHRDHLRATLAEVPGAVESLLRAADRIASGRFDLLGYQSLDFGNPVDWHLDPVHQQRAPLLHWSRVPYLDPEVVGDHKVIWELNRHQFLVTLAQAWVLTSDPRHPALAAKLTESWLDANPPTLGINWASSLELALRVISWTWVLHLMGTELPLTLRERMGKSLDLHGRHIERHLSTWFSPNTHLTGEALGLLYLGTAWPGFRRAVRWKRLGWRILLEQLPRQVRPDGTYFEQSSWYQGYTVDFYVHALQLAEWAGLVVPPGMRERVTAAAEVLAALARPDGTIPLIGDDDGGRLLPLGPRPPTGFGDTLAHAAEVLCRPSLTSRVEVPPHTIWLTHAWSQASKTEPDVADSATASFRDGGWFVARLGRRASQMQLVIDAGPHGALTGAHAHADALSLDLTVDGKALFADPGSRSYVGPERDLFRGTAWHSTLAFPDLSSAEAGGPFRWKTFPETTVAAWETGEGFVWFDGWHDGWGRLNPGLRHRRSVLCLESLGLIILDRLTGSPIEGLAEAEIRWHCASGVLAAPAATMVALSRDGHAVAGLASDTPGRVRIEPGRTSSNYGSEHESFFVVVRPGREALRMGAATAILIGPAEGAQLVASAGSASREWRLRTSALEAVISQTTRGISWRLLAGSQTGLPEHLDLSTTEPW